MIILTLNTNMNEHDMHVAVLIGIVDLTLLLRAKRVVSIIMFVHSNDAFISLPTVSRNLLCYIHYSLPGRDVQPSKMQLDPLHKRIYFISTIFHGIGERN